MSGLDLHFVAAALGLPAPGENRPLGGVSIDSRSLRPGALFVALRGPRFDGHDYLSAAQAAGAAAALVERPSEASLPLLRVDDTRAALGRLGQAWRETFAGPLVGITGSNGKTTVKALAARVLAGLGPVLATHGNLNNDLGVPLTLLRLRPGEHRAAVVEMGANHLGEIVHLARLARPQVGVVTHAGPAHLEGFGSLDGVARAKGELFAALDEAGTAVVNADDPYAPLWYELAAPATVLTFGRSPGAAVRAVDEAHTPEGSRFRLLTPAGEAKVRLPLPGAHNVMNALAAAAVGVALGRPVPEIAAALGEAGPVDGRLQPRPARGGLRLIDDSYNANPASLAAGLAVLAAQPGRRALVLGDMAELGAEAAALHRAAGAEARALGIERLYALGPLAAEAARAFGAGGAAFETVAALVAALEDELGAGDVVLVKGSRSAGMERVVQALAPTAGEG